MNTVGRRKSLASAVVLRRMISAIPLLAACLVSQTSARAVTYNFSYLNDPLAGTGPGQGTRAAGIYGNTVVGQYTDSSQHTHGFIYNGSTFTTLDDPLASGVTTAWGVYSNNVVGYYRDSQGANHGFLYNGSSYITLDDPQGANGSMAFGIYGNTVVGNYFDSGYSSHPFLYNGSSYTTLAGYPGGGATYAYGISGSTVAGFYSSPGYYGFTYNGSTYSTVPGSANYLPNGIDGNAIVGTQIAANGSDYGFVYDGSTSSIVDPPGTQHLAGVGSEVEGVSGDTLVGYYRDANGVMHGFLATPAPEPPSLSLAAVAAVICFRLRRRPESSASWLLLSPIPKSG